MTTEATENTALGGNSRDKQGKDSDAKDAMFGFRRMSDPTKGSADPQRIVVKDEGSESVASDSHDDRPAGHEPQSRCEKLHELMETQAFHIAVVVLVVLDCIFVIAELVLDIQLLEDQGSTCNGTNSDKEENEVTAVHVLHYMSLTILSIFMLELIIKIPVFRMEFFRSKMEVFDGIVIIISFVLDIVSIVYEEQFAALQLIVLLRLWRIVRVVNGVILSVETQAKKKIEQQKHLTEEIEYELEKFRKYCAAQEKEIEVLRNALNRHGIKIEDDFVAEKPKQCLNQLNVVVEMNSEGKTEVGGEGDGGEPLPQVVTLADERDADTGRAEFHTSSNA